LGKATAGEKSLRANTKLQKLQSKSTNGSPQDKKRSFRGLLLTAAATPAVKIHTLEEHIA